MAVSVCARCGGTTETSENSSFKEAVRLGRRVHRFQCLRIPRVLREHGKWKVFTPHPWVGGEPEVTTYALFQDALQHALIWKSIR